MTSKQGSHIPPAPRAKRPGNAEPRTRVPIFVSLQQARRILDRDISSGDDEVVGYGAAAPFATVRAAACVSVAGVEEACLLESDCDGAAEARACHARGEVLGGRHGRLGGGVDGETDQLRAAVRCSARARVEL